LNVPLFCCEVSKSYVHDALIFLYKFNPTSAGAGAEVPGITTFVSVLRWGDCRWSIQVVSQMCDSHMEKVNLCKFGSLSYIIFM